jgi:hypothetical protein
MCKFRGGLIDVERPSTSKFQTCKGRLDAMRTFCARNSTRSMSCQETGGDVDGALDGGEPGQLELGRQVLARTATPARAQFEGT